MSPSQLEYEALHTPAAKRERAEAAKQVTERAVAEAWQLCHDGDEDAARAHLHNAGLPEEGVAYYLRCWRP